MKKNEEISYTEPLAGVEEFAEKMSEDSVHDALQTTWETETEMDEQINCEQAEDK
ncbi:hypothetical protein [Halalkalibacter alkalisediminis]|uniref:Uncharacterized protein n=1 Tax=Halalkalibacter alkalisediminis TaxID=935616 RepID=A0ABV6NG59_9BACI|nr:hypothetical protein [Halalkalibacter alkalisediminis]